MNITNTIITRQATEETSNAKYNIEFTVSNGVLTRVFSSISAAKPDEHGNDIFLGNISLDNGIMNCSLQENASAAVFFEDFSGFMVQIKAEISKK